MDQSERREKPRFPVTECLVKYNLGAILDFVTKPAGPALPLVDLSLGGLQFLARENPGQDQPVQVRLDIPAFTEVMELPGTVRWTEYLPQRKLYRIGVQFSGLPEDIKEKLRLLENDPMCREIHRERKLLL